MDDYISQVAARWIIAGLAICAFLLTWLYAFQGEINKRRLSVRSLLALMAALAAGMGCARLIAGWPGW